jgi:gas vesicle protein
MIAAAIMLAPKRGNTTRKTAVATRSSATFCMTGNGSVSR